MSTKTATKTAGKVSAFLPSSVKTIDVDALEWFDRVNGNSYFAGIVTINFGMDDQRQISMPFQYGYGSQSEQEASQVLHAVGLLPKEKGANYLPGLSRYCREHGIIYRYSKRENCLKRDLKQYTRAHEGQTIVRFYCESDGTGDVFAYFPFQYEGRNRNNEQLQAIYVHVGQHGTASADYVRECVPASPDQYADLLKELQSIGYSNLVVI